MNKSSGPNVLVVMVAMSALMVIGSFLALNGKSAVAHTPVENHTYITLQY